MFVAQQAQVIQNANYNLVNIRSSEMMYFGSVYFSFGVQSALVAGFVFSISMYTSLRTHQVPFFYRSHRLSVAISFMAAMHVLLCSTFINVYGQGLALRGPIGSMIVAVDGMLAEQPQIVFAFIISIIFFAFSCICICWVLLDDNASILCTVMILLGMLLWYKNAMRIYNIFKFERHMKHDHLFGRESMGSYIDIDDPAIAYLKRARQNEQKSNITKTINQENKIQNSLDDKEQDTMTFRDSARSSLGRNSMATDNTDNSIGNNNDNRSAKDKFRDEPVKSTGSVSSLLSSFASKMRFTSTDSNISTFLKSKFSESSAKQDKQQSMDSNDRCNFGDYRDNIDIDQNIEILMTGYVSFRFYIESQVREGHDLNIENNRLKSDDVNMEPERVRNISVESTFSVLSNESKSSNVPSTVAPTVATTSSNTLTKASSKFHRYFIALSKSGWVFFFKSMDSYRRRSRSENMIRRPLRLMNGKVQLSLPSADAKAGMITSSSSSLYSGSMASSIATKEALSTSPVIQIFFNDVSQLTSSSSHSDVAIVEFLCDSLGESIQWVEIFNVIMNKSDHE